MVLVRGVADAYFRPVEDRFLAVVSGQAGSGAALCVSCEGRVVVDIWGGAADAGGRSEWERDSIVQPYSVCKPLAAACTLRLVDAGRVDLDAPVQRYWPEFRAPATVRHLLAHQAGVVAIEEPVPTDAFYDWDRLCGLLARQEPLWEPGTAHGESALFYGHLVGEVLRRVDGRALGRFLWEELCGPLELDFRFGLARTRSGPRCRTDRARRRVPGADGDRSARAVRAGHLESARVAGRPGRQRDELARRRDSRRQRPRHGPGPRWLLRRAGERRDPEPRRARRGHPGATLRPGPGLRRREGLGAGLRARRDRVRPGRPRRQLRRGQRRRRAMRWPS